MIEKFFFGEDNLGGETSALVSWAYQRGATEFSVNLMRAKPEIGTSPFITGFEADLAPFRLPDAEREHLEHGPNDPKFRRCALWQLTPESVALLMHYLPHGLVAPPTYSTDGWLENPRCYRDGDLLLGAITHEGGGLVRLDPAEVQELVKLPVAFRDQWEWIG